MIFTAYAFRNSYLDCYDQPLFNNMKIEDVAEGYRRQVLSNPDAAWKSNVNEKELVLIGEYDDKTGVFTPCAPTVVVNMAKFFPPGYLKKKEEEANAANC